MQRMKALGLALGLLIGFCASANANFSSAPVAHGVSTSTDGGDPPAVTLDTTGSDFTVVVLSSLFHEDPSHITDTYNGTFAFAEASSHCSAAGPQYCVTIYYCSGCTYGASDAFHCTGCGYATFTVMTFSGAKATSVLDAVGGQTSSSATSLSSGSVTPASNGELIVTGVETGGGGVTYSVDSGFTISNQGNGPVPGGSAYLIQGTGAAVNPSWSWSPAAQAGVAIATFLPATYSGGGGGSTVAPRRGLMGVGQ